MTIPHADFVMVTAPEEERVPDHGMVHPPLPIIVGNFAFATRGCKTRNASANAHPQAQTAKRAPKSRSLHRMRASQAVAAPEVHPHALSSARCKFRFPTACRLHGSETHSSDAPHAEHKTPCPPTQPKPEGGLRPRRGGPSLPNHFCSQTSLAGVMKASPVGDDDLEPCPLK